MLSVKEANAIFKEHLMRNIAAHYHVDFDKVTIYESDNASIGGVFCTQHRLPVMEEPEGAIPYQVTLYVVTLDKYFETTNNILNRLALTMTGQCQECGHVYAITFIHPPTGIKS